ncbi:uncharacterized protein JCM15063_003584 [Sporobolomyces koalae]|uniref:uncharacterized protein n=1 Tax=Sporobolomyces koalae TaxID=500713 RepID=UPI00316B30A3
MRPLNRANQPRRAFSVRDRLVERGEWEAALPLALDLHLDPTYVSYLAQHLVVALLPALDVPTLEDLASKVLDKPWLAATCIRVATNASKVALAHKAVELGIQATAEWTDSQPRLRDAAGERELDQVGELAAEDEQIKQVSRIRKALFETGDKIRTWDSIWGKRKPELATPVPKDTTEKERGHAEEEEHGWDDLELPEDVAESAADGDETASNPSTVGESVSPSQPRLSTFLSEPLGITCQSLAAVGATQDLQIVCQHHSTQLWPVREELLQALPEWLEPESYLWLLPAIDSKGLEADWASQSPWRSTLDWSEQADPETLSSRIERRTSDELTASYIRHIERIASLGLIDSALSLVQHGASRGIMGLDELGEELSLLSKLVYDRPSSDVSTKSRKEDLTLEYWRTLEPGQVVRAYLAHSNSTNIATSIRRLVLPYLSVLESRLERTGTPDGTLSVRILYDYMLALTSTANDLGLLYAIFESSKPTLPPGARIVKDDQDLAKLAIACLYGSHSSDELSIVAMGKIFECLPAFSDTTASTANDDLFSLSKSLEPMTPQTLFSALSTASAASLSHSLDLLDLQLSQLETFSRYSCPTPLSWFLTSHHSEPSQRAWATRLARTAASGGGGYRGNDAEFESEDEWMGLGEVMRDLTDAQGEEKDGRGKKGMGKAFWLLGEEEVWKIFFGGLLGAGRFSLAHSLFNPSSDRAPLEPGVIEELVISASRELYDNADEGNMNRGDMKLAFDCLAAAPQTPRIRQERDFIEATSRLCSFRLESRPGIAITPIEIRHSPDRLSFIAHLLSMNEDAFRHPDMLLEIVNKLGYRGDRLAEVRTLAMLADAAMSASDYLRAAEMCEKMVEVVEKMKKVAGKGKETRTDPNSGPVTVSDAKGSLGSTPAMSPLEEAASFAWRSCLQLGKDAKFADVSRRLQVLGQALSLCPPEQIASILPVWTETEKEAAKESRRKKLEELEKAKGGEKDAVLAAATAAGAGAAKVANFLAAAASSAASSTSNRISPAPSPIPPSPRGSASGSPARSHFSSSVPASTSHLAHEATAAASHTLRRAAAFLPFSSQPVSNYTFSTSDEPSSPSTPPPPSSKEPFIRGAPSSPPSRFAAAFDSLSHDHSPSRGGAHPLSSSAGASSGGGGFRAGLSSRFTQGLGWLIGADELLERERQEGRA